MIRPSVALGGGAAAWSLHLGLSYLVIGLACRPADPLLDPRDGAVTVILLALSLAAGLAAGGSAVLAARLWRRSPAHDKPPGWRGERGIAFVGLLLNLVFLATILVASSAVLVVPTC